MVFRPSDQFCLAHPRDKGLRHLSSWHDSRGGGFMTKRAPCFRSLTFLVWDWVLASA